MSGPFKMYGKSPIVKALIGKQKNLPEHLKQSIEAAPGKMYGESPAKHTYYKNYTNYKGELSKQEIEHAPHGKNRGEPISDTNIDTHIGQVNAWDEPEPMKVPKSKLTKELQRIKNK